MRAPRVRPIPKPVCFICKKSTCVENKIQNCVNLDSMRITRHLKKMLDDIKKSTCVENKIQNCLNLDSMRITRNFKKMLDDIKDFIILENYRCMPLLGDEENVPNWDVHIVRYSIVYCKK